MIQDRENISEQNNKAVIFEETVAEAKFRSSQENEMLVAVDPKMKVDHEVIDLKKVSLVNISKNTLGGDSNKERIIHIDFQLAEQNSSKITELVLYNEEDYENTDAEIRRHEARR